ncbi:MAG: flavodoxin family protein [Oscillospiraceae bacterium]|nr:flavodoxin family protein [Oscillospiraceae bacterium]
MKIAIRYQSRGGNTRAVAEVMAKELGLKAESIDKPLDGKVDVLFLGGGVYKFDIDPKLKEYLEKLDPKQINQIVAFTTTGWMKTALNKISEYAKKAGIKVNENKLYLRMMLQGHGMIGREGGHLTDEQVAKIKKFASDVLKG